MPAAGWGGVCSGGVPGLGGGWSQGGACSTGCLLQGVPTLLGVPAPGGWGAGIPACTEADMCKNITFVTSLRTVINGKHERKFSRSLSLGVRTA